MTEEEKNGKPKSQGSVGRKFVKPLSLEEKRRFIKFDQSLLELLEKVKLFQNDSKLLKDFNEEINHLCHNKVGYLNLEVMLESDRGNYRDAASLYHHRPSDLIFLERCSKEILLASYMFAPTTSSAEAKKSKNSGTITSTRECELQNGSGFASI